jgi:hypothetical protein
LKTIKVFEASGRFQIKVFEASGRFRSPNGGIGQASVRRQWPLWMASLWLDPAGEPAGGNQSAPS